MVAMEKPEATTDKNAGQLAGKVDDRSPSSFAPPALAGLANIAAKRQQAIKCAHDNGLL